MPEALYRFVNRQKKCNHKRWRERKKKKKKRKQRSRRRHSNSCCVRPEECFHIGALPAADVVVVVVRENECLLAKSSVQLLLAGGLVEGRRPDDPQSTSTRRDAQSARVRDSRRVAHLEPAHSTNQRIRSRMLHVSGEKNVFSLF